MTAQARTAAQATAACPQEGVSDQDVAAQCLLHTAERELAGIHSVVVGQLFMLVVHWGQPTLPWVLAAIAVRSCVLGHQLWVTRCITRIGGRQALAERLDRRLVWGLAFGGMAWGLLAWAVGPLGQWSLRDDLTVMLLMLTAPLALIITSYLWSGMLAFNAGLWTVVFLRVASDGLTPTAMLLHASLVFLMGVLYLYGRLLHTQTVAGVVAHLRSQNLQAELSRANQQLVQTLDQTLALASRDPLTQILNRRAFQERAAAEASAMGRHGQGACVMMLDLDKFKLVNDRHGHAVGDTVLVDCASNVQTHLRAADVLARWGGEEFIALLPHTAMPDAQHVAERVRQSLQALQAAGWPADVRLTTSIGLAPWAPGQALDDAIREADAALYQAKAAGRNRVCLAPPAPQ